MKVCSGCGKNGGELLSCSKCKSVSYCNAECQRIHWKQGHKTQCVPPQWDAASLCCELSKGIFHTDSDRTPLKTKLPKGKIGLGYRVRNYEEVQLAMRGIFPCIFLLDPSHISKIQHIPPFSLTGYDPAKHVIILVEVIEQNTVPDTYHSMAFAVGFDKKDDFENIL